MAGEFDEHKPPLDKVAYSLGGLVAAFVGLAGDVRQPNACLCSEGDYACVGLRYPRRANLHT